LVRRNIWFGRQAVRRQGHEGVGEALDVELGPQFADNAELSCGSWHGHLLYWLVCVSSYIVDAIVGQAVEITAGLAHGLSAVLT
jgi:hypothetical protein